MRGGPWYRAGVSHRGVEMYLFTRQVLTQGDPRKVLAYAAEIAALVTRKTELPLSVWAVQTGAPVGALGFSSLAPSRVELDAAETTLMGDEEYLDKLVEGQQFIAAPPEDRLLEIVHTAGHEYQRAEVGAIASITSAVITPGKYVAAITWGIEIADLVSDITGMPGLFGNGVGGPFGQVAWVGTTPDMATLEAGEERTNKDPRYLAKLDQITGLFVAGSGQRTYSKRIA